MRNRQKAIAVSAKTVAFAQGNQNVVTDGRHTIGLPANVPCGWKRRVENGVSQSLDRSEAFCIPLKNQGKEGSKDVDGNRGSRE